MTIVILWQRVRRRVFTALTRNIHITRQHG